MLRGYYVAAVIAISLGNTQLVRAAYGDSCNSLTGDIGQCLPAASCRDIGHTQEEASCGDFNGTRHFCCPKSEIQHNSLVMNLFESKNFNCGRLLNLRVANGKEVNLASRPWMSLLRYNHKGEPAFLCGGSLISDRYVLTAAHCLHTLENEIYQVRLGEHRISTDIDCVQQGTSSRCAPPVEDIDIDKIIIHEQYNDRVVLNDIALIRLSRKVEFNNYIKPICLPITDTLKDEANKINNMFVTGWGTTENGSTSDVLLQAKVPVQSRSLCSLAFSRQVPESQICVGGEDLRDSCKGDSGGPLQAPASYLKEYHIRMVEFGIVSLGVTTCGRVNLPGLYTNVASFMQWITDKMAIHGL